jgi:putative ABC transport system permease protein
MSGTLVLTDTIGKTFDDLFADVNAGTDAYVRGASVIESDFGDQRPRVDAALVDTVRGVDGVAAASGSIQGYTQIIDTEGSPSATPGNGAPTYGGNWIPVDELNPFVIVDGAPPASDDEVVIDKASADDTGYAVVTASQVPTLSGRHDVTVSGHRPIRRGRQPGRARLRPVHRGGRPQSWSPSRCRFGRG